ncbi:hypothetical protein MSAN_01215600 [Mycena sanguinolenta]|uniref:Uncharacterized protein n=1 Tax=Mycena sanguinolenta TaxID=230812 RepID=A0A8H7D4M1_9AGAR|nr:hypothetical protein MSAN_01215600 [Mycena sanguinolenta]
MMFIALIAPEAIFALALRQYSTARSFHKDPKYKFSMTHGFFIVMGGFVTKNGNHPIAKKSLVFKHNESIKNTQEVDIADKSKNDRLAKIIMRAFRYQGLETTTLGLALIQCLTGFFWLNKPQRVSEAIPVDGPIDLSSEIEAKCPPSDAGPGSGSSCKRSVGKALNGVLFGSYPEFDPMAESCVPSFWSGDLEHNLHLLSLTVCASVMGFVHLLPWWTNSMFFPSSAEMWLWRATAWMLVASPILCLALLTIKSSFQSGSNAKALFTYLTYGVVALYIFARSILVILCFTTLRGVPAGMLTNVDWRTLFH